MDPELINIINRAEVEVGDYPEAPPPIPQSPASMQSLSERMKEQ